MIGMSMLPITMEASLSVIGPLTSSTNQALHTSQIKIQDPLILLELSLFHELFWYATTTLIAHIDWLFYTCNLYLGLTYNNQSLGNHDTLLMLLNESLILGDECLTASLSLGCALHLFNAETHFAWFKPIHNTSVTIMGLSLQLTLFETGIKVVDLLTPYKKGGKIELFGGAGVGKTVVIMEFIRNLATHLSNSAVQIQLPGYLSIRYLC